MIGQTISHYKILEKLGEGGMGVVYKAEDTKLKRIVALKFLPPHFSADDEVKQRFIHEAQAASALNHTNICSIHTIEGFENPASVPHGGTLAGKQQFIDMEFVEGKTLGVLLKEKELPLKEVVDIALQIAEGLYAAHRKGIVHRDIKPDNIMITDENLVKIMDFGLAKLKGSSKLTKTHSTLGTLSYMSPEQARGEEVDQRSDIFSFGAVLYEMITGRRAFKGEHEAAIIYSLVNETPEPLARYKTNVPDELQRVVDKALSKDKNERYQHVDEMTADLRRVQHSLSGSVTSTTKKSKVPWIVAVACIVLVAIGIYLFYPKSVPTSANRKSIAVLPFKNLSSSKDDEYFSDGIAEDIRTQLSNIADLKVISQQGVLRYKNSDKSITEIGKELGVATVLEGSVQHAGSQVRINAQLIDASDESHIWADKYDKEMTQIFSIQSEVAQKIAEMLRAKLLPSEKDRIERKPTANTDAYQLYLKGRFYWNKRTASDLEKSIGYFKQAIEKDSFYALAYAGLASTYGVLNEYSGLKSSEYMPMAESLAKKALELDSTSAEAHAVLGLCKTDYEWDWVGGENHYKCAIKLNPGYATAHHWYSLHLSFVGRFDEAMKEIKIAQELDPLSLVINTVVGVTFSAYGQHDKAIDQHKKTLELDPNFALALLNLGFIFDLQNRFDEAIVELKKVRSIVGDKPYGLPGLGLAYAHAGKKIEALKILDTLFNFSRQGYSVSSGIALVYSGLGNKDKAFEWLDRAYRERDYRLCRMKSEPMWDDLRSDPRFFDLLKKIGLEK